MHVEQAIRGQGTGRKLVEKLVAFAEQYGYMTISARVAEDLPANAFWDRLNLVVARSEKGGVTTGRQISIRVRELETPTLFTGHPEKQVPESLPRSEQPIYLLDVNVFLDFVKDRERADAAKRLITASLSGTPRLFVTKEFVNELSRAAEDAQADPILRVAAALPQFPHASGPTFDALKEKLAELVFPRRKEAKELRNRDLSDLIHLATTVHHSAAGFVTSDEAILRKRDELRRQYGIEVIGPTELAELCVPSQWPQAQVHVLDNRGTSIDLSEVSEDRRRSIEAFLKSSHWTDNQIAAALAPGHAACLRHRLSVSHDGSTVAFASWDPPRPPQFRSDAWLSVDPLHPLVELASDALIDRMARDICASRSACARLHGDMQSQFLRLTATSRGFAPIGPPQLPLHLEKYCIGGVVSPPTWAERRIGLIESIRLRLPEHLPEFRGPYTPVQYSIGTEGEQHLPLLSFEVRFGPVIMLLPKRPVVVIPIQPRFADQLLGTGEQHSLFSENEAHMWPEKLYLCSPKALTVLGAGAIALFYESQGTGRGRGAIVAIAEVVRTAIRKKDELHSSTTRRGVLSQKAIKATSRGNETALIYFSQAMPMTTPVPIRRLRQLRCMDGANFVTARQIDEAAAWTIIEEGHPSVRL